MLHRLASLGLFLFLPTFAFADTITLSSGEKIDGVVTGEANGVVTIEYRVSAGVTDTREVKKAEIVSVEKPSEELIAWRKIERVAPMSSTQPQKVYEDGIAAMEAFIQAFPQSANAAEAKKRRDVFQEDLKQLQAGLLKFNGVWISKNDAEKEQYQLQATAAYRAMVSHASRDAIAGLNAYEQIAKSYRNAAIYPDAVDLARTLVPPLQQRAEQALPPLMAAKEARAARLRQLPPVEQERVKGEARKVMEAQNAIYNDANNAGQRWKPWQESHELTLRSYIDQGRALLSTLSTVDTKKLRQAQALAEQARAALKARDAEGAGSLIKQSLELWTDGELARRLEPQQRKLTEELAREADAARMAEAKAKEAEVAKARAAATAPTPSPVVAAANPASPEEAAATEPKKPFFQTPQGASLLVVIALLLLFGYKGLRRILQSDED